VVSIVRVGRPSQIGLTACATILAFLGRANQVAIKASMTTAQFQSDRGRGSVQLRVVAATVPSAQLSRKTLAAFFERMAVRTSVDIAMASMERSVSLVKY
jgi:hypothetical protein